MNILEPNIPMQKIISWFFPEGECLLSDFLCKTSLSHPSFSLLIV